MGQPVDGWLCFLFPQGMLINVATPFLQLGARNNTDCYYWVAQSHKIKRLEMFSKLPFNVSACER